MKRRHKKSSCKKEFPLAGGPVTLREHDPTRVSPESISPSEATPIRMQRQYAGIK